METIRINIIYKGNFRKHLIFLLEEDCLYFLKKYGVNPYKDLIRINRADKPGTYYLVYFPDSKKMGAGEDDKNLEIEEIIIGPFYELYLEDI